jgi:hypothetical protein
MDPLQRIQYTRILGAISHMDLVEHPINSAVHMTFEFHPERLPAELSPPSGLKKITDAVASVVIPEMGQRGAVEWTLAMGEAKLELKFAGDDAEQARNSWPSVMAAIQNLRSQHLLN